MNTKYKLIGFCFWAICATSSNAAVYGVATTNIVSLENAWEGEGLAIHVSPGTGVAGCGNINEFAVSVTHKSYKDIVAMAIAAQISNAKIQLIVDTNNCLFGNRTRIVSLKVVK